MCILKEVDFKKSRNNSTPCSVPIGKYLKNYHSSLLAIVEAMAWYFSRIGNFLLIGRIHILNATFILIVKQVRPFPIRSNTYLRTWSWTGTHIAVHLVTYDINVFMVDWHDYLIIFSSSFVSTNFHGITSIIH